MARESYDRIEIQLQTSGNIILPRNGSPTLTDNNGLSCNIFHAGKCALRVARPTEQGTSASLQSGWNTGDDEVSAPQKIVNCAVCPVANIEHTELIRRGKMVGWTTVQSTTLYNPNNLNPSTTIASSDGTTRLTLSHDQTTARVSVSPTYAQGPQQSFFQKVKSFVLGR